MAWVVAALVFAAIVFVAAGVKEIESSTIWQADGTPKKLRKWKLNGKQFLAIIPLFLVIGGCVVSIPAGHTGVLTTFGNVEDKVLSEGVNFKLPYQQVIKIDNLLSILFQILLSIFWFFNHSNCCFLHWDTAVSVVTEFYDNCIVCNINNGSIKTTCCKYCVTNC